VTRRTARILAAIVCMAGLTSSPDFAAQDSLWLGALDLSRMHQGWGRPRVDSSVDGKPLRLGGTVYRHGVGTHARAVLRVDLRGAATRFRAVVGVNDSTDGNGSIRVRLLGDGKILFESGLLRKGRGGAPIDTDLRGIDTLILMATDGGDGTDYDHADLCDARILFAGEAPRAFTPVPEAPFILTPVPGPAPRINGARVVGCRPGHPFLHRIPCTGQRPIAFSAVGLPAGLTLDANTGIIRGVAPVAGKFSVMLKAKNVNGTATAPLRIVSGDTLALTPPMGWNHWYAHYNRVTAALMREAADVMDRSGMADAGYQYVSIDDCWMNAPAHGDPLRVGPLRDDAGNILPNKHFPDMNGLTDYIHSRGLKAGIYTSPGRLTCAGFAGTLGHEAQDAKQFAAWGFDFLKYDWCSYTEVTGRNPDIAALRRPYEQMGSILHGLDRDIVLNLCQYGMGNVWEWGAAVGGQCWRTAGDLGYELDRIFDVALRNASHRAWSRPGSWNDPDYIQIGYVGSAMTGGEPEPTPVPPRMQYAYMSLWSLMASPIFFSGEMSRLDPFTLNILCNPEVIDVNQDPLGQCATVVPLDDLTFIMVKDLEDGSKAVGFFNRDEIDRDVTAEWSVLGVQAPQAVRDLWRQKDLGTSAGSLSFRVAPQGAMFVRLRSVR
jgi:alpha-galactosidase